MLEKNWETSVGQVLLLLNSNPCPYSNSNKEFLYTMQSMEDGREIERTCWKFNKDLKSIHIFGSATGETVDLSLSNFQMVDFVDPDTTYRIKHYTKTISNNWIILEDTPCPGMGGRAYEILNPGQYNLRGGCWLYRPGDKYITAIDVQSHETFYWDPSVFKDFNGELK